MSVTCQIHDNNKLRQEDVKAVGGFFADRVGRAEGIKNEQEPLQLEELRSMVARAVDIGRVKNPTYVMHRAFAKLYEGVPSDKIKDTPTPPGAIVKFYTPGGMEGRYFSQDLRKSLDLLSSITVQKNRVVEVSINDWVVIKGDSGPTGKIVFEPPIVVHSLAYGQIAVDVKMQEGDDQELSKIVIVHGLMAVDLKVRKRLFMNWRSVIWQHHPNMEPGYYYRGTWCMNGWQGVFF